LKKLVYMVEVSLGILNDLSSPCLSKVSHTYGQKWEDKYVWEDMSFTTLSQ